MLTFCSHCTITSVSRFDADAALPHEAEVCMFQYRHSAEPVETHAMQQITIIYSQLGHRSVAAGAKKSTQNQIAGRLIEG